MKVIKINPATGPGTALTVTVEIGGVDHDLAAIEIGEGKYRHLTIYGLAVRYRTGQKVWPGEACYWPPFEGRPASINNVRGPQDHRRRFANLQIVGFWQDVKQQYRSEHFSVKGRG